MTKAIVTPSLDDRLLSVAEAAEYLGVNPMTVRNMLTDGRLTACTLGPRVLRIRLSAIESALQPYGGGDHAAG
jgi:excisionase family DNA binding protein